MLQRVRHVDLAENFDRCRHLLLTDAFILLLLIRRLQHTYNHWKQSRVTWTWTHDYMRTTITTILRPLYRSTCVSRHIQLRTRGFCWCKVLLPHTLADGNQHMWIREETMKFLNSLSTLSPYPDLETKWLKSWLQDRSCAHSKIYSCDYTEYWERRLMLFPESQWVVFEFRRNPQRLVHVMIDFIGCCIGCWRVRLSNQFQSQSSAPSRSWIVVVSTRSRNEKLNRT